VGIEVTAKFVSDIAAAQQEGAVLSHRHVIQKTGAEWEVGNLQTAGISWHEGALGLQLQIANREKAEPYTTASGAPVEAETLLEIAGLSECPELERTGLLRCCRRGSRGEKEEGRKQAWRFHGFLLGLFGRAVGR
jgi:hypothetical protein